MKKSRFTDSQIMSILKIGEERSKLINEREVRNSNVFSSFVVLLNQRVSNVLLASGSVNVG